LRASGEGVIPAAVERALVNVNATTEGSDTTDGGGTSEASSASADASAEGTVGASCLSVIAAEENACIKSNASGERGVANESTSSRVASAASASALVHVERGTSRVAIAAIDSALIKISATVK
jgi:hypothetical protein